MIAVPAPAAVQGDDEQIAAVQVGELGGGPVGADHGVAEGPGHAVEDRGLKQEAPLLRCHSIEDLRGQVLADLLAVAGQRADEVLAGGVGAQRQPGELHARRPALGALLDLGDAVGGELEAEGGEVGARLGLAEAHLAAAQLHQLVACAQARQHRPRRVGARRHREVHRGRQALHEGDERAMDLIVGDRVQVVEDENDASLGAR